MDEKSGAKSKLKGSANKHNHANDRDSGEDTSQSGGEVDRSPVPRPNKKTKRREPSPIPEPRSSKRQRAQYQPFQSPTLHIPHSRAKPVEEKVIVFYKSEFLALRNESGSFFICQAAQNVYKSSRRFKIRWLSKVDSRESDVYSRDFYDFTDFECVLTNLRMDRLEKNLFRLPKSEHNRTENILRRALNLENGIRDAEPEQIEKDGVDVSKLSDAERKDDKENETSPSCSTRKSTTDSSGESSKSPVARPNWKSEAHNSPKIRSTRSGTLKIVRSGNLKATISLRSKGKGDPGYRIKRNNGRGAHDDEDEDDDDEDDDASSHYKRKVNRVPGRRQESASTHVGRLNPNASVTVFPKDPMFESNTTIPFISVSAHSKLLIRAVLMNDIIGLQKLLSDSAHPCSIGVIQSVDQKYDALAYALMRENHKAIQILMKEWQKSEPSTLKSPETLFLHHGVGRYNFRTLGVEVREMSLSRGAREGNSALMKDCHQLLTEQDYINLMLQNGVSKSTLDLFCNLISKSKHNVKEKVMMQLYLAVCGGHRQLAGQLVEDALSSDGYGFNYLHKEVLLNDQQDLSPFRQAAVRKHPFTNCGITPLHCASINPNPKYLKSLLDVDPDFNVADKRNRRVIHYAAACEGPAPLELLLSRGVKIDDVDIEGNTALHMASGAGRDHNVDLILRKAKADRRYADDTKHIKDHGIGGINRPNRAGFTPLHLACMKDNLGVVKVLVKNGANLEKQTTISRNRVTALMLACQHGHAEVMRFLLQSAARLEARDKWKRTALTHAVMNGHAHIVSHLLRIGADASVMDSSGNTLLHYAVAYGWWFCVELLLDIGAKVNASNEWKVLPLGIAFLKGHIGIVDLLLEKTEVDVNFKDDNGLTIIMLAVCSPLTAQLVEHVRCLIVDKKANCVDTDIHGNTALHWLACNRIKTADAEDSNVNAEVVQTSLELANLLLDNGCDPSVRNHQGQTALKLAIEQGNNKLVQLLLRDSCQVTAEVDDTGENLLHDLVEHMCDADLSSLIQIIKESQTVRKPKKPSLVDDTIDTNLKNPRMPLLHSIEGSLKQGCAIHIQASCNGTYEKFTMSLLLGKNPDKDDVALELSLRWPAANRDRKEAIIVCNRRVGGVWNKDPSEAPFSTEVGTHNQNRIELDVKLSEESYQVLVSGNMLAEFQTDVPYGQVTHLNVSGDVNLELIQIMKPMEMTKAILARLSAPSDVLREMAQTYSYDGFTPLLLACSQYQFAADKKQSARLRDMIKALIEDAESEVHAVVKKRSDNKSRYIDGYSALHFLASGKDVPVVSESGEIPVPGLQLLLSYKPPINVPDNKGRSPLICAILNGQQSAAEALINMGADVNLCSSDIEEDGKASPLILASKLGLMMVVKLLLKHRADVQVADAKHGNTALHYAVAMKTVAESVEIVHCLVEAGININATNSDGCTPLHLAVNASTGSADYEVEIEEYLIERGANLLCQDKLGRIPLHFAFVKIGRRMDSSKVDPIEVVSLLTSAMKPGNIDQADCFGQTPLHCAAFRGATISCMHLALAMKNLNAKDKNGNTALGLAVLGSHDSCATMLIQQGACVQVEVVIPPPNPAANQQSKRRPWQWLPVAQGAPQQQSVPILQEVIKRDWQGVMYMMLGQLLATGVDHFPAIEAALQTNKFNLALSLIARTKNVGKLNIKNNEEQNLLHILSCKANTSCNLDMQVKVAQVLVKKGISVGATDKHGSTPIIYAAMNKNAALCEYFTAHLGIEAVCMLKPDKFGRTPITAAFWNIEPCQWNNSKLLPFRNWCEKLCVHGCSVNVLVQYKFLDMFPGEVCVATSVPSSRQHLDLSLPIDPQPPCRISPLIFAICLREYNLVSFLMKNGADLNFPDLQGRTPLMHAVRKNDIGMVKLLLNPKYCYKGDLWYAVQKRNIGRKHLNKLYINTQNKAASKSETIEFPQVLQQPKARFMKNFEKNACTKLLAEEVVDADVSSEMDEKDVDVAEDLSPKTVPAARNSHKMSENDVSDRMDVDADDTIASFIQTDEISCLKLQGAPGPIEKTSNVDLAQTDKQGWTVIHHLVRPFACGGYDNLEMLITLAEVGAPLATQNAAGLTPLHLAVLGRSAKLANMLGKLTEVPGVSMVPVTVDDVKMEDGLHWDTRVYDFNADARLVLERAENEAMEEGEEDCHVLPDVHSGMEDMGEVTYDPEQNLPYDVFLTKVEVASLSSCIYNFFKMQVISQRGRSLYILFTRSGMIGTEGQYQQHPYHTVEEATKEFCRLFKAKTGNNWVDFKNFEPLPRKYRLVETMRKSRRRLKDIAIVTKSDVPSRLPDYLEDLMNSLTRLPMLQEACCDIGVDASVMPFGRLCEAALLRGRQILKELRNLAAEKMKLLEDSQNRERIVEIAEKIVDFSSEYFQVVPQYGYSCEKVQPLESLQEIQKSLERLDDIFDLELVSKMLLGAQLRLKEISPLDYVYRALRCQICVLKEEEADAQYILQYIHNTALTRKPIVECIFRVSREVSTKPNAGANVENKWLLWHSSAVSGVLSVLHCGVAIAPSSYVTKDYPGSSHKLGKEIRFTDVFEMSQRLGRCQNDQSSSSQYAFLCEVSLGNMKECEEDGLASLQDNHNSAKILGTYFPDPAFNLTLTTGITVPLGLLVFKYNNSGARILRLTDYNQYLVTKSNQVNVRYLVRYRYEQFDRKMKTTKVPTHS